ncbi:MAG: universal stress protein [Longimicrobiales bacterium]
MYRSILVPLDGSRLGEQALPTAIDFCKRTGAELHVIHVRVMAGLVPVLAAEAEWSADGERKYLEDVCEDVAQELGKSVTSEILPQDEPRLLLPSPPAHVVGERIVGYVTMHGVDLIVMTTHGRGGLSRAWFGSVTESILRLTAVPLFLVRPTSPEDWKARAAEPIGHLLIALDGSAQSEEVLEPARELGIARGARCTLLRVIPVPFPAYDATGVVTLSPSADDIAQVRAGVEQELARVAQRLRRDGVAEVAVETALDISPAGAILSFADEHEVDAIALTTHARGRVGRFVMGSVADKVIRGADCPVLVMRPATGAGEERQSTEDRSTVMETS